MIGDPCGVRRARIEGVREGNSGACLQHVWPVAKEVGKRGDNNRHDWKFVWVVVRIKSLAVCQYDTASPLLLIIDTCPWRWLMSLEEWISIYPDAFFHHRVLCLLFRTFFSLPQKKTIMDVHPEWKLGHIFILL